MENLKLGDLVKVSSNSYEPVYSFFAHWDLESEQEYLQIFTGKDHAPLEVTPDHLMYNDSRTTVPASQLKIGDVLLKEDGMNPVNVTEITKTIAKGRLAPLNPPWQDHCRRDSGFNLHWPRRLPTKGSKKAHYIASALLGR